MRHLFFLGLVLSRTSVGSSESTSRASTSTSKSPTAAAAPSASSGASADPDVANFGQTINVLGLMERTDQDFVDGLALDLFSPTNRTLVVEKNTSPLPGTFVTGSSGAPFISLSNYSWVVKLNETAKDLIAKIELPYDPVALQKIGIDQGNTYVGTLSADKTSWVVSESQRNVHVTENKTRIIKMTSLDGEYMLLGRKTEDFSNIFVQYGQGATRTVNLTAGPGVQEAEFVDGLRFAVKTDQNFTMNVDIKNGIPKDALPDGSKSLNSFSWVVNTSMPTREIQNADIRVPINRAMLETKKREAEEGGKRLVVAKRALNATSGMFTPLSAKSQEILRSADAIKVSGLKQLDGQYILLVR